MNYLNLGMLKLAAGDVSGARSALETATVKAPRWNQAWLNLGAVCEAAGDADCAAEAYARALTLAPAWKSDPYWQVNGLRAEAAKGITLKAASVGTMESVVRQSYARPVLDLAEVRLAAGQLDEAEQLLKLAPLMFQGYESDLVDAKWLAAELAAGRGQRAEAAALGREARQMFVDFKMDDVMATGLYVYAPWIYLLPWQGIDLVPQAVWMQYPGDWSQRMEELKTWQE
jgi:tetratricopeptide (TPR) repeat protein